MAQTTAIGQPAWRHHDLIGRYRQRRIRQRLLRQRPNTQDEHGCLWFPRRPVRLLQRLAWREQPRYRGTDGDAIDYPVAAFMRYSRTQFNPDPVGDLLFNGVASRDIHSNRACGVQSDLTYRLTPSHTLRGGIMLEQEQASFRDSAVDAAPGRHQTGFASGPCRGGEPVLNSMTAPPSRRAAESFVARRNQR